MRRIEQVSSFLGVFSPLALALAVLVVLTLAMAIPASSLGQSMDLHVESNRPDALVLAGGRYLGRVSESPFRIDVAVDSIWVRDASITRWNAESIRFEVPKTPGIVLRAHFPHRYDIDSMPGSARVLHASVEERRRRWIDVVSLSGAVLAGALAVHYRTKADHRFEEWEADKSPHLKREIQRLDVMSGVSVGVMQVGIGVFAFRLVF